MKCIDADKLKTEIINRMMSVNLEELGNFGCHRVWAYNDVKDLITSLQQEQPEVDLEKDIKTFTAEKLLLPITGNQREPMDITEGDWVACAYHFYELGLNARKD